MQHPRKRTIGVRVPDHVTTLALLDRLGEPLILGRQRRSRPRDRAVMNDGWQIATRNKNIARQ